MKKRGIVYLVGAGPGDPGLLTVKGQTLLRRADVVVYDHLVSPKLLKECPRSARLIYVGKESDRHTTHQQTINRLLVRHAKAGKTVIRLKGGDPFVFGRGGEEALALVKARVPFEVVPGVTSALAVPAYAGIPVTHRGLSSSFTVITGHEDPTKESSAIRWQSLATAPDTLICLMGVGRLPGIVSQLIRHGRKPTTPCAVIEWGTYPAQRTVKATLKTMTAASQRAAIRPPAILIVGDVVTLRDQLNWFEQRPLAGCRILVTRAAEKAEALAERLESLGAQVVQLPAIELLPLQSNGVFKKAIAELPKTDWVFFTSPEGIGWFSQLVKPRRTDLRALLGCHIGAIGPKTAAAIEERGLHVDFVPRAFSQEGVLRDLPKRMLAGKRGVIFCAEESRDVLTQGLRRRGMRVAKVPIYRTATPPGFLKALRAVIREPFSFVTVTSASCVEHVVEGLRAAGKGEAFRRLPFASIGPVTSARVRAHGGRVIVEANPSTIERLIEAMVRYRAQA